MLEFTIRPAGDEADRIFVRGLNGRLSGVIDAPTHLPEQVEAFQDRFTASAWAADAGKNATFVAVGSDGERLGYVNVREGADDIANEKCGYVALLAVVAEAEGLGVGQALIAEAGKWTREMGFARLALDVFASNDRAQIFYERAGFRPETVRMIKRL